MNITISTFGARGDVQPYLALAVGLQKAGHRVTLATSNGFTKWIEAYGVRAHPTGVGLQEFGQRPESKAVLRSGNPIRVLQLMRAGLRQSAAARGAVWAAIDDAELVIQSPTGTGALEAASTRGLPAVFASPVPFAPTRTFPSIFLGSPHFSLGRGYNWLSHLFAERLLWSAMGGPLTNPLRKQLGLKGWGSYAALLAYSRTLGTPMLYAYSAHVWPKPADWDTFQHLTGYWFLDPPPGWSPDAELLHFLESGPPPVYIGFGSMDQGNPEGRTRLALRALELSGQRGVLLTGWGGLARQATPPSVHFVDNVPHAWLFPRVAAVVHHGGAGTTSAGLRAGVPSLLTPFAADQPAWAERVVQLGVGPRLPAIGRVTAETLAEGIRAALTDTAMRARAAALGEKLRAEDGLARAVELIERHAAGYSPRGQRGALEKAAT